MVDRTDIDALLIGALYGELTPADEARLTAHLESHPADRGALADLRSARQAVRESRILEVQLDPPQAISALLLQEAHRRAPRAVPERGEGWFARFVRSFMAHPAMAAAAMFVVVLGIAGTVYMKNGGDMDVATRQVAVSEPMGPAEVPATPPSAVVVADAGVASATDQESSGSAAYAVGLADKNGVATEQRDRKVIAKADAPAPATKPKPTAAYHEAPKKKGYVEVQTKQAEPKELDEIVTSDGGKDSFGGGGASAGAAAPGRAPVTNAPSPKTSAPPPPPPPMAQATVAQPPADSAKDLIGWAKSMHDQAVAYAKRGDCVSAGRTAADVKNRAPDYYAKSMANDRALKQCMPYIENAIDNDAEKSSKARASKRVNADEAPAADVK